ncbi:MAG TPA: acyl-CoA dehydrogenase [Burkholderiaceae bacterium]|jgi:alkylation response protein AidB-like acyl-CoA dehydrogenase|nr:acyl-CoA dehydrogenase [Burkholderiaceae bacterium]
MNFEYTEEQQQLADSIRKYLANEYDFEKRKAIIKSPSGLSDAAWSTFAEMGLTAIALPEADGGFGGGAVDLMAPMEACGEALVVEPLLDNIGLAGRLISRGGSAAQRQTILPGLIDGKLKLAFAYLEPGARYELTAGKTTAKAAAEGWVLDGQKSVVIGAPNADKLVVSARTSGKAGDASGVSLFVVDAKAAGVAMSANRTVDGQRAADIQFSGVKLGADALLGPKDGALPLIEEAIDFATALLCADAIGTMKNANDATLEYLKTRKQFGQPIGSFQALQHRMVDMYIVCEQARSMAILAATKVDAGGDANERKRAVSSAKVKIADAARQVSQESVQLHGGMGMTEELKVSHNFRRLTMIAQRFGDADHHLERYASLG